MTRGSRATSLSVLLLTLVCATSARADVWSIAPRVTDHTGTFLRLAVGLSGVRLASTEPLDSAVHGVGALWDVAIGYSVAPSIALHVGYFGARPFVPRLSVAGEDARARKGAEAMLSAVAIGATFHLPKNLYLAPSVGVALVAGTDTTGPRPARDFFDPGAAAAIDLGWEFWVSPQWALGVALKASYYYVRDDDGGRERTWHGAAGGPMFTSTFN